MFGVWFWVGLFLGIVAVIIYEVRSRSNSVAPKNGKKHYSHLMIPPSKSARRHAIQNTIESLLQGDNAEIEDLSDWEAARKRIQPFLSKHKRSK